MLAHLAASRAVDPGVSHGQLPVEQELVLFLQAGEASPFECVVLNVVDALLDLTLVARCVGPRRPERQAIMLTKGLDLGVELRFEPVGLLHRSPEVIQNQAPWCSTEMAESTLEATEEVVGGLAVDSLAVSFAGVGQHNAKDMSFAALAVGADVDLSLVAGPALEAAERELARRLQAMDETTDAVIAAREVVFCGEILVDALGTQTQIALGLDQRSPGLALALATVALVNTDRGRRNGLVIRVWPCL